MSWCSYCEGTGGPASCPWHSQWAEAKARYQPPMPSHIPPWGSWICNHCYCTETIRCGRPHVRCCKCGDVRLNSGMKW